MHTQKTMLEAAKGGQVVMGPITPDSATLLYMQPSFAAWPIIVLPFVAAQGKSLFRQARLRLRHSWKPASASASPRRRWCRRCGAWCSRPAPENYDLSALTLVSISGEAPAPSDVHQLYNRICKNICCVYLSGEAFTASGVLANTRDLMERGKIGSSGRPGGRRRRADPRARRRFRRRSAQRRDRRDRDLRPVAGDRLLEGPGADAGKIPRRLVAQRRSRPARTADNYLWVSGRIDNVINTGGIKVSGRRDRARAAVASPHRAMRRGRPARPAAGPAHRGLSRRPRRAARIPRKSTCSCARSAISPATRCRRRFTGSRPCRPGRPENCSGARCGPKAIPTKGRQTVPCSRHRSGRLRDALKLV